MLVWQNFQNGSLLYVLRLLNRWQAVISHLREFVVNQVTSDESLEARLLMYRMDWKVARWNVKATKRAIVRKRHKEKGA